MTLSPSLTLSSTLLVPSLSHKLLSINQVTTDLNCIVLIYPTFCLLQDILTKEIIGRGTKRGRGEGGNTILAFTSSVGASVIWLYATFVF